MTHMELAAIIRAKNPRTMRVLLRCDWEDLNEREQERVTRWMECEPDYDRIADERRYERSKEIW